MSQGLQAEAPAYTIVSLQDVLTHLRYPASSTSDDAALMGFITAATDVIRTECGQVVPTEFDEYYDGGDYAINTRNTPILSVINVEEGWGWTNYELQYIQVNSTEATNMFAYSIDDLSIGLISRRSGGNVNIPFMAGSANIRVTYIAGRSNVPGALRLAALELIAHWWQGSQQRATQYQSSGYDAIDVDFSRTLGGVEFNSGIPLQSNRAYETVQAHPLHRLARQGVKPPHACRNRASLKRSSLVEFCILRLHSMHTKTTLPGTYPSEGVTRSRLGRSMVVLMDRMKS